MEIKRRGLWKLALATVVAPSCAGDLAKIVGQENDAKQGGSKEPTDSLVKVENSPCTAWIQNGEALETVVLSAPGNNPKPGQVLASQDLMNQTLYHFFPLVYKVPVPTPGRISPFILHDKYPHFIDTPDGLRKILGSETEDTYTIIFGGNSYEFKKNSTVFKEGGRDISDFFFPAPFLGSDVLISGNGINRQVTLVTKDALSRSHLATFTMDGEKQAVGASQLLGCFNKKRNLMQVEGLEGSHQQCNYESTDFRNLYLEIERDFGLKSFPTGIRNISTRRESFWAQGMKHTYMLVHANSTEAVAVRFDSTQFQERRIVREHGAYVSHRMFKDRCKHPIISDFCIPKHEVYLIHPNESQAQQLREDLRREYGINASNQSNSIEVYTFNNKVITVLHGDSSIVSNKPKAELNEVFEPVITKYFNCISKELLADIKKP